MKLFNKKEKCLISCVYLSLVALLIMDIREKYLWALSLSRSGKYAKAVREFSKLLSHDPGNADVLSDRGVARYHLNDVSGALSDMTRALQLEPENPYRYASRAYIREKAGDTNGAIDDYRKSVELDPENLISLNSLGLLEEKLEYIRKARSHFGNDRSSKSGDPLALPSDNEVANQLVTELLEEMHIITEDVSTKRTLFGQMFSVFTSINDRADFLAYLKRIFPWWKK